MEATGQMAPKSASAAQRPALAGPRSQSARAHHEPPSSSRRSRWHSARWRSSSLLTTTVQLGQLMGVAVLGSVYLSRAAVHPAAAMSGTASWLAVLSVAALAALIMVRGVSRRSASS